MSHCSPFRRGDQRVQVPPGEVPLECARRRALWGQVRFAPFVGYDDLAVPAYGSYRSRNDVLRQIALDEREHKMLSIERAERG